MIIIVNRHEPEHEVAARLLELAEEQGHDARSVEAVRGEHDAALSFRVPHTVGVALNKERSDRWPDKIENDDEKVAASQNVAGVNEDAYAADATRRANAARAANTAAADETKTSSPTRRGTGKATRE